MGLAANDRAALLSQWIEPSSSSEADRQERAERMVRRAIEAHPAFANTPISVFAKGSYANNTNVRLDSDVDIVVQCNDCTFYDYGPGVVGATPSQGRYTGIWTPAAWRREVENVLVSGFGSEVDTTGNVAIRIPERYNSRPSADVVPSFDYELYWSADQTSKSDGSVVYTKAGPRIVNWPQQQLEKGRARNISTGQRYKRFVRALKNCENQLVLLGAIKELPSYFMECLVWNAADSSLVAGSLDEGFRATLLDLWGGLESTAHESWLEPNCIKYAFNHTQKWTRSDALGLVRAAWNHLYSE